MGRVYGRVHGPYRRPCTRAVYTAGYTTRVHGCHTAVYGQCTRPVRGRWPCRRPVYRCTRLLHGNVRSVYGPRTGPCTCTRPLYGRVHPCTCIRPCKAVYTAIFGPCIHACGYMAVYGTHTRPRTCLLPGRVRAGYDRVDGRVRNGPTGRVHGRVDGRYTSVCEPCTRPCTRLFSAACSLRALPCTGTRRATVVYTARVRLYTCTRPLYGCVRGRVRAVSAHVHGRVRAVYTTGPIRSELTTRIHVNACTSTPPSTGRVHGHVRAVSARVHGLVQPYTRWAVYAVVFGV